MPATRPPSRSVIVAMIMPQFEDLVSAVVVADHVSTPATIDKSMRYGFLSLPVPHAADAENLDRVWVCGAQLTLFELHGVRALFAHPDKLMAAVKGFAKTVRDEEKQARGKCVCVGIPM
ncbi:hypothetical protein GGF31_009041 [Allomyces arbusculus]|nr:hypothetical protein GGF31_009041 [Allomyces arbusculus]